MDVIGELEKIGYQIKVEGDKIFAHYLLPGDPPEMAAILLEEVRRRKAEVLDYLRLLQTPQTELEKPIRIESGYLGERLYLVANEEQAREIEQRGGVCYLSGEIRALLGNSQGMDKGALKDYLIKIHMTKKAFPRARIH